MKNKIFFIIPLIAILTCVSIFFYRTIFQGKLPVPSDTLVGMYHPWLDTIANEYPNGIPYKNFLITDPIRQQIPWRKLAIDAIKKGNFHPWNPYSFSGTPLVTNIQSGFYYPLNGIFFLLSFPIAWSWLIILQQILSGFFFYIFLKLSMKVSTYSSLFGALCFMFCGFSIMWLTWGTIDQTLLWLPLLLVVSDWILSISNTKKRIASGIFLGLIVATQYFAGHSQIFLYSFLVFTSYTIFRFFTLPMSLPMKKKGMLYILGGIVFGACITAIHWIPFLSEYASVSRLQIGSFFSEEGFFIPYQHMIQFLIPDFFGNPATFNYWGIWNYAEFCGYIGVTGLFFVLVSLFSGMRFVKLYWFAIAGTALIFALPSLLSKIPYILHVPIVSSLQPTRLLSVVDVALCVLAAFGFQEWMNNPRKKSVIISMVFMTSAYAIVWYVTRWNVYGISNEYIAVTARNIIFPTVILAGCLGIVIVGMGLEKIFGKQSGIRIGCAVCMIVVCFYDLSRFGWKFTPFTDSQLFFPPTSIVSYLMKQPKPFRIVATDDRIMPPNVNAYYDIESVGGYDPLYESRYETFMASLERGEPNIAPPYGFRRIITPKNISSPLFSQMGVKYVLTLSDLQNPAFTKIFQEGQTRLYEYADVIPRIYIAEKVDIEKNPAELFKKMYASTFIPGKQCIVEDPIEVSQNMLSENESSRILSYADNSIEAKVEANAPRLLCIGNPYNRGWKAYIDGNQAPTYRVNYLFMGVVVPEGTHTVQLTYE